MRKVSRWVPIHFTPIQVQRRLTVASNLFSSFETEENNFVSKIFAIDETWVWSYESEMKRQDTEWLPPNSPRPPHFRREQRKLKVLMIFAYDIRGALTSHRVETGQIMNDMCYKGYIQ